MEFLSIYQLSFMCLLLSGISSYTIGCSSWLENGSYPTVNSWFIIGQRDWDWKKLHTELNSVADWNSEEQKHTK